MMIRYLASLMLALSTVFIYSIFFDEIKNAQAAPPGVTFTINGGTAPVIYPNSGGNYTVTLAWSSTGASWCESSGAGGASWGYNDSLPTAGSASVVASGRGEAKFIITCFNTSGESTTVTRVSIPNQVGGADCAVFPELVQRSVSIAVFNVTTGQSSSAFANSNFDVYGTDLAASVGDKLVIQYDTWSNGSEPSGGMNGAPVRMNSSTANSVVSPEGTYVVDYLTSVGLIGATSSDCGATIGAYVQLVQAAPTPDFSVSCSPASSSITLGGTTSFNLTTAASNGFSSPITFSSSMTPSSGTLPQVSFTNNGQVPPAVTVAQITTSLATTPAVYTITFTGTGGSLTKTCSVQLTVSALAPTADIRANGSNGPVSISYNTAATITWSSSNATSCTVSAPGWTGTSGTQSTGNLTATQTYTLNCTGPGGNASDTVQVIVGAPPVSADIQANGSNGPITITYNTAATLSWTSANASSCTVTSTPAGFSTSGTSNAGVSTGNLTVNRVYTLACTGPGGNASDTVTVNVGPPPVAGDIRANGSNGPISITYNTAATISWSSSNATSCSVAPSGWTGTSGSQSTGNLTTSQTYTLSCTGPGGNASDSVQVNVGAAPTVGADIQANGSNGPVTITYNTAATITWTSSNATSCTVSAPGWTGTSGSQSTGNLTTAQTYTLNCTGPGGNASDAVTVNVGAQPTFSISCSPLTDTIEVGSSTSFNITITGNNGFNQVVSVNSAIDPFGKGAPEVSFANNNETPPAVITSIVTTDSGTSEGNYQITYTASSAGYADETCVVSLEVASITPPNSPGNVNAQAGDGCGTVEVTWNNPSSGPTPTGYRVYRRTSPSDPWQLLTTPTYPTGFIPLVTVPSNYLYSVLDPSPLSLGSSNYYAVASVGGSGEAVSPSAPPVIPQACSAEWDSSDKDILEIGSQTNINAEQCNSGTDNPPERIYSAGDAATFAINICNSGDTAITNLVIDDDLRNNLLDPRDWVYDGCTEQQAPVVSSENITFYITEVGPAVNDLPTVCQIQFTATLRPYYGADGTFYKFFNRATVTAPQFPDALVLETPLLLYREGAGVPVRNETAP